MSRFTRLLPVLKGLSRDSSGSVAVVVAVTVVALSLLAGMAIDMGRALDARNRLQHSLDASGLAVGAANSDPAGAAGTCSNGAAAGSDSAYMGNFGQQYMNANFNAGIGPASAINVCESTNGQTLVVTSSVTVNTTIMRIIGYTSLTAHAYTRIERTVSGLELVMLLDNSGSMSEQAGTTTAIQGLKNASLSLVNQLWSDTGNTTAQTPNDLYVGVVPFSSAVNVLNTNTMSVTNYATGVAYTTTPYEILGADANLQVKQLVNTTTNLSGTVPNVSTATTNNIPPCGYLGTYVFDTNDYIHPLDLIHLAQDLCIANTSITFAPAPNNAGSYTVTGATAAGNIYLVDALNSSSKNAWGGCVEARTTSLQATAPSPSLPTYTTAPYWDSAVSTANAASEPYDLEMSDSGITAGTYPSANYYWHIYRAYRNAASYYLHADLPSWSAWHTAPTTVGGDVYYSQPSTTNGTTTQTYYWPHYPILATTTASGTTWSLVGSNDTQSFTSSSTNGNYYWDVGTASSPNLYCKPNSPLQPVLPLTNIYSSISSELSNLQPTSTTLTDEGMAWTNRILSYGMPFPESATIEQSINGGPSLWKKAVVIMTDGQANMTDGPNTFYSYYQVYGQSATNGLPHEPWTISPSQGVAGDPILTGLEANQIALTPVPGWVSDPNGNTGTTACNFGSTGLNLSTQGQSTGDQYQIMCHVYSVCLSLRAQDVIVFTVLFNHDGFTPGDAGTWLQQCTADGNGNVAVQNAFTATTTASLNAAFNQIAGQLRGLRLQQ